MKVRFLGACVTGAGVFAGDQVAEIDGETAAGLIAAGHAVRIVDEVEEATTPGATERAVSPKRRR